MPMQYNFYATLLDAYQSYLDSDKIWENYWGWSENPPHTPEEFRKLQFQSLIDKINRVPFDSEAADRGTAFNELIDCINDSKDSDKITYDLAYNLDNTPAAYIVGYNNRTFTFPYWICLELVGYFTDAVAQQYVEAELPTKYGIVKLYGYIDELMPDSVHDIKTTGSYSVGKFKGNWQHLVYPYCLHRDGCNISRFEYNIVEFSGKNSCNIYTELYNYDDERDTTRLKEFCEDFICFLNDNKDLITDKKIFNNHE